jgi:Holliday junction resolvase RusA-like endonuclease
MFEVVIPGQPPSVNHMYSRSRTGGVYKSPGVEAYQILVSHLVKLARPKGWEPRRWIRIEYDFLLHRHADCDNLQKALNDAIAGALGVNDDCFLPCVKSKRTGAKADSASVTIHLTTEDDGAAILGEGASGAPR